jgi:hypothetical protein
VSARTVLEEDVHCLPERVVEHFDQFLADGRVCRRRIECKAADGAWQTDRMGAARFRCIQRSRDGWIAARRRKPHHDVVVSDNCREPCLERRGQVEGGQSPLADDDGMDELDRDMLSIGSARAAAECQVVIVTIDP